MKMFRLESEGKCGGCNWAVSFVYVLAETEQQAKELYEKGEAGLCGDCMCDMLSEASYEVVSSYPTPNSKEDKRDLYSHTRMVY